jgi:hypothetical protein
VRRPTEGDVTRSAALAKDPQKFAVEVDVNQRQRDQLPYA